VIVGPRSGKVGWGPKTGSNGDYDQPVANLLVHYGGTNQRTLATLKLVVSRLK
jgi:hypothetical protein